MIALGLKADDLRALHATLRSNRRVRTRVQLLDRDTGHHVANLTDLFTGGQIDVDGTADVTRSATLTIVDEHRKLPITSDSPARNAIWADRAVEVIYDVLVDDEWVPIPVFSGPINLDGCTRDGQVLTIEAHGWESQAMGAFWTPMALHKGMRKTDAIRRILSERAGETHFDIPDLPARLPNALGFHRDAIPWHGARRIARSISRQLFYNGEGACRLRHRPNRSHFTFTGAYHVLGPPQVRYSGGSANAAYVFGGVPKGAKTHVHATAVAQRHDDLSPWRQSRNGVPFYLLPNGQVTRDDLLKTVAEAQARADRELHDALLHGVDVAFDSAPVPFLDPGDLCRVVTDDGVSVTFRLQKFSLPLAAGEGGEGLPMTIGYHRDVRIRRGQPRRGVPKSRR